MRGHTGAYGPRYDPLDKSCRLRYRRGAFEAVKNMIRQLLIQIGEGHCAGQEVAGDDTGKNAVEKQTNIGDILKLDEGRCEGPGVVAECMQQQSAPSYQN